MTSNGDFGRFTEEYLEQIVESNKIPILRTIICKLLTFPAQRLTSFSSTCADLM